MTERSSDVSSTTPISMFALKSVWLLLVLRNSLGTDAPKAIRRFVVGPFVLGALPDVPLHVSAAGRHENGFLDRPREPPTLDDVVHQAVTPADLRREGRLHPQLGRNHRKRPFQ